LRLFQALVAAAAARWNERIRLQLAGPALSWLEGQRAPTIVAAPAIPSQGKYRLYVPDNVGDKVARSWSLGREASIAGSRTEKDVRPMHLLGEAVHYLYPLPDGDCPHFEVLSAAARSITHLGWGVDMVTGHASLLLPEEAANLPGELWRPFEGPSATGYRVPVSGTLDALLKKYQDFLNRLGPDGFIPVPPLSAFDTVGYRRDTDLASRPFAAFALLSPDADTYRAFDTVRRTPAVAGMVRHAAQKAATFHRPDDPSWVSSFVLGHGDGPNQPAITDQRLAYLPIPTIEERKQKGGMYPVVGSIRRVLVMEPLGGTGEDAAWLRQRLSGQQVIDESNGQPTATLSLIPKNDPRLRWYVPEKGARVWSTVTPVILPGYDDRDPKKTEQLLLKTLEQAGFPYRLGSEVLLEWRREGFRPGADHAKRYRVSSHHDRLPRYHVRLTWPVPVRGPVCLGAGRYYGLGLFAAEDLA
jgi:CRISPR-associated protein Csb2